ncbi:MAG: ABC transporter ATP-binding protein/permease [Prevotella sp.]|nr:ABC transporter ATP-binding protein/permease [Staphylococcus sp.]MCM1350091.1 ABC transporter ATP-binding protein/permease [Prevotella sp.]
MKQNSKKGARYLVYLIGRFFPMLLLILVMSAIDSATYTYVSMFIKYIIAVLDNDIHATNNLPEFVLNWFNLGQSVLDKVLYASIGLFLFQFVRGIFKFLMGFYRQFFGEVLAKKIRKDMYHHIQELPYSYHNNVDTGDLIQRCTTDNDTIRNCLCSQLPELVSIFAVLITAVFQMWKINRLLMMVSLIIVPIAAITSIIFCIYTEKKFEEIEKEESKLMSIIQENIAGVRVVKAFANESFEKEKFEKQNLIYSNKNLHLNKVSAIFWGLSDASTLVQYLITMTTSIFLLINNPGIIRASDIVAIMMLLSSYIWPVRSLGRIVSDLGKCNVAAGRVKEILDLKSEYEGDSNFQPEIQGKIEFSNVSFQFDDTDQHLLSHLSFQIEPGETVAIIGKTGSGKSTIAKILTRLIEYQEGSILIDGHELKDIKKEYIRSKIGLILQEPFLFARTVYDNIRITNEAIDPERIAEVAKIASIEKDIRSFEKGYDTMVGEKGATLSGGQKQRLAIARMLLIDKPIYIFDDSLSAVDTETDLMIRQALKKHNQATTIIITHRITTAKQADKIIVLENGGVSAIGTHETLAQKEGLYQKLWNIQGNAEAEFMNILREGGAVHGHR